MSDITAPDTEENTPAERDLTKELKDAAEIGQMVLKVAEERSTHKYSLPYLNPSRFSPQDIEALGGQDVAGVRQASVNLAVEAAAQVAEAQAPKSSATRENLGSLEQMQTLLQRSHGFLIQAEAQDHQVIVNASREAVARRQNKTPDQVNLTDEQLKNMTYGAFKRAEQRISGTVQAVHTYLRG